MNLQDVEIGRKYIWEWDDEHRYFATALRKKTAGAYSSSWVTR
jgi:hypothetical protein